MKTAPTSRSRKNVRASSLLILVVLVCGSALLLFLLRQFFPELMHDKDIDIYPRFIVPTATSTLELGGRVRIEWTPMAVAGDANAELRLLSSSLEEPGVLRVHFATTTDVSGSFTFLTIPEFIPAGRDFFFCFFNVGSGAGNGERIFCSDQFGILPKTTGKSYKEKQGMFFTRPAWGDSVISGAVETIAWTPFEPEIEKVYDIILESIHATDPSDPVELDAGIAPKDGSWSVYLHESTRSGQYRLCITERKSDSGARGENVFCSDPFQVAGQH